MPSNVNPTPGEVADGKITDLDLEEFQSGVRAVIHRYEEDMMVVKALQDDIRKEVDPPIPKDLTIEHHLATQRSPRLGSAAWVPVSLLVAQVHVPSIEVDYGPKASPRDNTGLLHFHKTTVILGMAEKLIEMHIRRVSYVGYHPRLDAARPSLELLKSKKFTQYERVWEGSLTRFVRENCRRPRYQDRNDNCFTEGHEVAKADFDAMYAYMYDPLDSAFTGYYRKRWFRAVIQDILELEEMKLEHARRFST